MVSLQNKVAIIPFVEFGSHIFGDGRHRVNIVTDGFPLIDQIQELCFPNGPLENDFLLPQWEQNWQGLTAKL
jgi:hypothetical protein